MTPKQEAALRQALEALEVATTPLAKDRQEVLRAQAAIREALAEQPAQQEPVAWMDGYRNIYSLEEKAAGCPEATIALVPMANQEKTSGSPINELQCVCGAVWLGEEMVHLPDKRPPASKPWVSLTLSDLPDSRFGDPTFYAGAQWAEAKLKEKNA